MGWIFNHLDGNQTWFTIQPTTTAPCNEMKSNSKFLKSVSGQQIYSLFSRSFTLSDSLSSSGGKHQMADRGITFDCGGPKPRLSTEMYYEPRLEWSEVKRCWRMEVSRAVWAELAATRKGCKTLLNWLLWAEWRCLHFPWIKTSQFVKSPKTCICGGLLYDISHCNQK